MLTVLAAWSIARTACARHPMQVKSRHDQARRACIIMRSSAWGACFSHGLLEVMSTAVAAASLCHGTDGGVCTERIHLRIGIRGSTRFRCRRVGVPCRGRHIRDTIARNSSEARGGVEKRILVTNNLLIARVVDRRRRASPSRSDSEGGLRYPLPSVKCGLHSAIVSSGTSVRAIPTPMHCTAPNVVSGSAWTSSRVFPPFARQSPSFLSFRAPPSRWCGWACDSTITPLVWAFTSVQRSIERRTFISLPISASHLLAFVLCTPDVPRCCATRPWPGRHDPHHSSV